ncbi:hypothetical protein LCGC14_0992400 [marine sediment metagenome]|uniref:V-type proton ATPase subunit E n=1 Tax=marine sediment metagenome TaxID=412755 RepID=A0A0F9RC19_9ZZZZ
MKLDKMLKALEVEANEQGEKILADAQAQVDEILTKAKKDGEKRVSASLEKTKQRLRLKRAKIIGDANFEEKKSMLNAKDAIIEKLFTKIKDEAKQGISSDVTFFEGLADEALLRFKGQDVKMLVNSRDKEMAEQVMLGQEESYQIEGSLNCIGGLKVVTVDSNIVVDNTIEARLRKIKQLYEPQIMKKLFGEKQ